ncbi:hypothetical protein TH25_22135 [Thalassospira profundimaris]|uniref:diguanylate cyclase n=1 Tax=Thalassospira profundimaris TaxID=502049 RepID=A0A367WPL0_9PROT|nr:sensor domain-containing diguanylate cyclase [Thalassospira profundimaris]RCK43139.1 hypothetical protein TH25_22135 [Thalassospira profundimaris]
MRQSFGQSSTSELKKLKPGSSIFARQLRCGLLVASFLGVLIILYQGIADYLALRDDYEAANARVINEIRVVARTVLFDQNADLARTVANSAMFERSVVSVKLMDIDGNVIAKQHRAGANLSSDTLSDAFFGGIVSRNLPIYSPVGGAARGDVVGQIQISFSPQVYVSLLYERIKASLIGVLIFAVAMTFSAVGVTYFIVTRPLLELINYMVKVNPADASKPLPLPPSHRHDDEIQMLGSSLIGLLALIRSKVQRIANVTDELKSANLTLESRVEQRTRELNSAIEKLELLAATDPLTGLANRRTLMGRLKNAVAVWKRRGTRVGLIIVDLDHFKILNDTYGHQVGDMVLKSVARVFVRVLRETDLVARLGGEEFAVLLGDEDENGSWRVAERLREEISRDSVCSDDATIHYTASLGIACLPVRHDCTAFDGEGVEGVLRQAREVENIIDALYSLADKALYQAKENGRNRCEVMVPPPDFLQKMADGTL